MVELTLLSRLSHTIRYRKDAWHNGRPLVIPKLDTKVRNNKYPRLRFDNNATDHVS